MIILQANKINKSFGEQQILRDVSLSIKAREKIGLVGNNGAGKTTLLKCLTGSMLADSGEISYLSGLSIGCLEQLADYEEGVTIWEAIMDSYAGVINLRSRLNELETAIAQGGSDLDKNLMRYARCSEEYELADGYACENTARKILNGLGFAPDEYERQAQSLSGGQKTRLNMACTLAKSPDLLCLDEPTNHLDISAVEWLEDFVRNYPGSVLVVSHDRRFLDKTATRILDLRWASLSSYEGNYSQYTVKRASSDLAWQRAYDKQQEYIRATEAYIRRFKAGIKSKQARGRQSQLQRLERMECLQQEKTPGLHSFKIQQESGHDVLRLQGVAKSFGQNHLFKDLDLNISKGEKIALVGSNGCGKTTLLKIISNRIAADEGEIWLGSRVGPGYYGQEYDDLNPQNTVLEEIMTSFEMQIEQARNALGSILFSGDDVFKTVKNLSGGEKGRLALLKLIMSGANFLLLDEPTNHLDLDSCQTVEKILKGYEGTLLMVSHDRYFIDQIADRVITLQNGRLESYHGNYSYYQEKIQSRIKVDMAMRKEAVKEQKKPAIATRELKKEQERIRRKRRRELEDVECQIMEMEEQKGRIELELSDPLTYNQEETPRALTATYKELEESLQSAYSEWERLSRLLEEESMEGSNDELLAH